MSRISPITIGASDPKGKEKNDCVVRAISNFTGFGYTDVFRIAKLAGRESNKGTPFKLTHSLITEFGIECLGSFGTTKAAKFQQWAFPSVKVCKGMTVGKFIESHAKPNKKYVVVVSGHAFCVSSREIIDISPILASTRVISIYSKQ